MKYLEGYDFYEAKYYNRKKNLVNPYMLIFHSGALHAGVAEYFHKGDRLRKVSTHFAWHGGWNKFVQCVPLDSPAYHVGGCVFRSDTGSLIRNLNNKSIGIEFPGPWDWEGRPIEQFEQFEEWLFRITIEVPSIRIAFKHRRVCPGRKCLGPTSVTDAYLDRVCAMNGLVFYPERSSAP